MDQNELPNDNGSNDNGERHVFTETFVFTGTSGQSLFATMQNIMNRLVNGPDQQPDQLHQQDGPPMPPNANDAVPQSGRVRSAASDLDSHIIPNVNPPASGHPSAHRTTVEDAEDVDAQPPQQQRTMMDAIDEDDEMPDLESLSAASSDASDEQPPAMPRPMRPLPRNGVRPTQPHAHFHAHTPNGTIDLFTFSVGPGDTQPPPPSFTINLSSLPGRDVIAGVDAFFLMPSMEKEREPDIARAKVLLRGMETVPEGLVRRLERAGGVPGGHGTEESGSAAGCAVCWGPLLDEVEPGEWETALHVKEKEKTPDADVVNQEKSSEDEDEDEDELRGRIVALPCAHVYHAECLLPWFSRQTTCPTCRLDVDPDSLTWKPRPPRVPPPPQPQQPEAPNDQPPPPPPPRPPFADASDDPQPQDPNTAEGFRRLFNSSPFVFWPSRGPPADNQPTFGPPPPPPPPPPPQQQHVPPHMFGHPVRIPVTVPFPGPLFHPSPLNNAPPPSHPPPPPTNLEPPLPPNGPVPPAMHEPPPQRGFIPFPMFFVQPGAHAHGPAPPPPRREHRKWTPPDPVGKTLRQRVEQKERELGLRCDDAVCGAAPTDEEPVPLPHTEVRVQIHAAYDAQGKACEHAFHPACLVMSARVAGVTGTGEGEGEVQVACPACRAEGSLRRAEWEEGVRASEAEIA